MDMSMLDIFWYIGIAVCVVYTFMYGSDAIKLSSKKKNCIMVEGKARSCKLDKKWAYTSMEVKYEYEADHSMIKGISNIKTVLKPTVKSGSLIHIYYDKNNAHSSFLEEEIKSDMTNILVLVIMGVILIVTLLI